MSLTHSKGISEPSPQKNDTQSSPSSSDSKAHWKVHACMSSMYEASPSPLASTAWKPSLTQSMKASVSPESR